MKFPTSVTKQNGWSNEHQGEEPYSVISFLYTVSKRSIYKSAIYFKSQNPISGMTEVYGFNLVASY